MVSWKNVQQCDEPKTNSKNQKCEELNTLFLFIMCIPLSAKKNKIFVKSSALYKGHNGNYLL